MLRAVVAVVGLFAATTGSFPARAPMHVVNDRYLVDTARNGTGAARIDASVNASVRLVGVDGAANVIDVLL